MPGPKSLPGWWGGYAWYTPLEGTPLGKVTPMEGIPPVLTSSGGHRSGHPTGMHSCLTI